MPWFSWLLNFVYAGLLIAVSPVLAYRMLVHGKYREGRREKFLGSLPPRNPSDGDPNPHGWNR
jgi:3-deoxy-D-manno-octulosonic-acid transferase